MSNNAAFAESIINMIGSFLCVGRSTTIRNGFISKLIQDIRFINTSYSTKLENILQSRKSRILDMAVPKAMSRDLVSHGIPSIYTKYGFKPSFLINFWGRFVVLSVCFILWSVFTGLLHYLHDHKKSHMNSFCTILKKLSLACSNFIVAQTFGDYGYVVFFSALEMMSLVLRSAYSSISFALSLLFIVLGLCLIGFHFRFIIKYQRIKQKVSADSAQALINITKKYEILQVLYNDFYDVSMFRHGYLSVLAIRSITISVIVTSMLPFPLLESALFVCCSVCMCLYLLFNKAFRTKFDQISHTFLESCVLGVYICVLLLTNLDHNDPSNTEKRDRLELAIIIINLVIKLTCILFMVLDILQVVWKAYKDNISKKEESKTPTIINSSMINESNNSRANIKKQPGRVFC